MRTNEPLPNCKFYFREYNKDVQGIDKTDWVIKTTEDIFIGKTCIVFSVPGPFTPICSGFQLPQYEKYYNEFRHEYGIDEIYCHSVADVFVFKAWFKEQGIKNVKMLPDGNGDFARNLGMYVKKEVVGMGKRSWRHAFITTPSLQIERMFAEPHIEDNLDHDPYEESSPQNLLEYLRRKKSGEDLKLEWLYPNNITKPGDKTRTLGLKEND
jgi:thioredoxin-dependent peroxiredoxin